MTELRADRLRVLAAELKAETKPVARVVDEIEAARNQVRRPDSNRLLVYGAAALLETFYSGVERSLTRIAAVMGGLPEGPSWHRTLLEEMTLEIPKVRPPVFSGESVKRLEPYLAFRHRFRNLYLFDLGPSVLAPLLVEAAEVWVSAQDDIAQFTSFLEQLADRLDGA